MKTKKKAAPITGTTHHKSSIKQWIKEIFSDSLNVFLLILSMVSFSVLIDILILVP